MTAIVFPPLAAQVATAINFHVTLQPQGPDFDATDFASADFDTT